MIDRLAELGEKVAVVNEEPLDTSWARWETSVRRVIGKLPVKWHYDGQADVAFASILRLPVPRLRWVSPFGINKFKIPILPKLLDPKDMENLPNRLGMDIVLYLHAYHSRQGKANTVL